jgi:hypothetical protein
MTLSLPNIFFHIIASFMIFLTLEETGEYFISHKNHLIRTIKKWLSDKSSIQIDLRMSEADLNKLEKAKEGK